MVDTITDRGARANVRAPDCAARRRARFTTVRCDGEIVSEITKSAGKTRLARLVLYANRDQCKTRTWGFRESE